jgi:hypothetical protein
LRYLASNPRWEIREEGGLRYAVRLEKVDGKYETTLNGFYNTDVGGSDRQTRVIVSFDRPYGFGHEHGNVTRAKAGTGDVAVIVEGPHAGTPGHSSYLIVEGSGLFLEIYDQAPDQERRFTKAATLEVCRELREVLEHRDEITATGRLLSDSPDAAADLARGHFEVNDGMQPGIYLLDAAVNATCPGYVYAKVFETTTGKPLSAGRITPRSKRFVGWSESGDRHFPYKAELTVYEGDWSTSYPARFELWHHADDGTERKLVETSRMIFGWQM